MIRSLIRTYRTAFGGLPRELWLLSLALLVNRSGGMVLPFLGLYLTQDRGLSAAEAGRVLAAYGAGALLGAALGGLLTDRIGATRAQQLFLATGGAGLLWLGTLRGFGHLVAGTFAVSALLEGYRPALMSDLSRRAPPGLQLRAFALLRLAANLGLGIGPAVGGLLAGLGYRWLFVADSLTCLAALVLLVLTLGPAPPGAGAQHHAAGAPAGRPPWRDGPFLATLGLVVLLAGVLFQTFSTLPLYLRLDRGIREHGIGLLLALNPLLIALFEMVLIHAVERLSPLPLVGLGSFLMCAGFALMPLGGGVSWLCLSVVVWTVGEMLALPLTNALVAGRAGPGQIGRYMGLYTMAFSTAFVFAPAIGTWTYQHHGANALWWGIGAVGPILWIWALALRRPLAAAR